jgi:hypothetical protein
MHNQSPNIKLLQLAINGTLTASDYLKDAVAGCSRHFLPVMTLPGW